jgi:hypothetical protein
MAIGGHHNPAAKSETWLTPQYILTALGPFDLDPCAAEELPQWAAPRYFTHRVDGLSQPWHGRVWLNPPYTANKVGVWMRRLADHGDGIALIFARTETETFFETVWRAADAVFFFEGRINFHFPNGTRSPSNAGAPSCLVAYGQRNEIALRASGLRGITISLKNRHKG